MTEDGEHKSAGQLSEQLSTHPEVAALIARVALTQTALIKKSRDMQAARTQANTLGGEAGVIAQRLTRERGQLFEAHN